MPSARITGDIPLSTGAALGYYSIAVVSGDETASGGFEVQEYRKPEFEVRVTPAERFVVQGGQARVAIDARYYFGQPVANATRRLGRPSAALLLAPAVERRRAG